MRLPLLLWGGYQIKHMSAYLRPTAVNIAHTSKYDTSPSWRRWYEQEEMIVVTGFFI